MADSFPAARLVVEGIVATVDPGGGIHLAAMGPEVDEAACRSGRIERLLLKPFETSQTAAHLARLPEGVFHLTDDVLLVTRLVVGSLDRPPAARPAERVRGFVLEDACMACEFRVEEADRSRERGRLEARVLAVHTGRPFIGFNRARHAVIEGAILVTRLHLLGAEPVARRFDDLRTLVDKTGGDREQEAFGLLLARVGREQTAGPSPPPA
jgi:hypothetical protein